MDFKKIHILLSLLFLLTSALPSMGQRGWELGAGLGPAYYFGDLNTEYRLTEPGFAGSAVIRYNYNTRVSVKVPISYASVRADDRNSSNAFERARNLNFTSNLFEVGGQLEFNFFSYEHGSDNNKFTPYLFSGFSFFTYQPKTKHQEEWVLLRELGTEGQRRGEEYPVISPAFIFGGGIKFDINYYWSINIEISARALFNDYLDDVSKTYVNRDQLSATRGELSALLSDRSLPEDRINFNLGRDGIQRGNGKNNDSFNFFTVNLMYYFGQLDCPSINKKLF
jgi:hypothetical protein